MSKKEIEYLQTNQGEFISINSFLSTSLQRKQAHAFLSSSSCSDEYQRVLFQINADPRLSNIKSFSNVTKFSSFPDEDEILLMIGSIFRLKNIEKDRDGIWIIDLVLCSDDDCELKSVFQYMKNRFGDGETTLLSFGRLLAEMGQLDQAENYFHRFLNQQIDDPKDLAACYHALGNIDQEKGKYQSSLVWFQKTLTIANQLFQSNHPNLANTYNSVGIVHSKLSDCDNAIRAYEKALEIYLNIFGEDHPDVAMCLTNLGGIYEKQNKFQQALESNEKALKIWQKHLPKNHPNLAHSHSCLAIIHRSLQQYQLALDHFHFALHIAEKSFPSEHVEIAKIFEGIALVHEHQQDYQQALTFYQKSSTMFHQLLSSSHPDVIRIEKHIQRVSAK